MAKKIKGTLPKLFYGGNITLILQPDERYHKNDSHLELSLRNPILFFRCGAENEIHGLWNHRLGSALPLNVATP